MLFFLIGIVRSKVSESGNMCVSVSLMKNIFDLIFQNNDESSANRVAALHVTSLMYLTFTLTNTNKGQTKFRYLFIIDARKK